MRIQHQLKLRVILYQKKNYSSYSFITFGTLLNGDGRGTITPILHVIIRRCSHFTKPKEHIEFVYYGYGIKLMQFSNFIYPIYYILSSLLILINMQEKK